MICSKMKDQRREADGPLTDLGESLWFLCPGCNEAHRVPVSGSQRPRWEWNGSLDAPTLSPSILIHGGGVCHSFVENGRIRFLGDCTHGLKNQMVPLPELPDWLRFA